MDNILKEGCLHFDFGSLAAKRFDISEINPYGMKAVDFIAESDDCVYYIEVKDFQNPKAPQEQRNSDLELLLKAGKSTAIFNMDMGTKIKDSLLRQSLSGVEFDKKIIYLLLIRLDQLTNPARRRLAEKILGYVPTDLNRANHKPKYTKIKTLDFDLVDIKGLKQYGITCTAKPS